MKKDYIKLTMRVVELQHKMRLLGSSETKRLTTSGLDNDDELNVSEEGGGNSILDR